MVHNKSVERTLKERSKTEVNKMKIQKFEGLPITNQVFKSHSNNKKLNSNKAFYDIDSVDSALKTDSIDDPILPQIVRKFKKAYNIIFPAKVVEEAQNKMNQIDNFVGQNLNIAA